MQKAHKYTENSIKHELHNRNIKTQSSQHNKNTENERKNKKGSYRTVIPAVLCKHILFSRCCLSPLFKLYFYWVHKGSEERINLINEISPSLSPTPSGHHSPCRNPPYWLSSRHTATLTQKQQLIFPLDLSLRAFHTLITQFLHFNFPPHLFLCFLFFYPLNHLVFLPLTSTQWSQMLQWEQRGGL